MEDTMEHDEGQANPEFDDEDVAPPEDAPAAEPEPEPEPVDPDAQAKVEADAEQRRGPDGDLDLSKESAVGAEEKADPEAEDAAAPFDEARIGDPDEGAMSVEFNGQKYEPVACGEHRSGVEPAGFQPGCDDCADQMSHVREHIRRVA